MKTVVKAKKTLIFPDTKEESFTKGQLYFGESRAKLADVRFTNNQGMPHSLGGWRRYFEVLTETQI